MKYIIRIIYGLKDSEFVGNGSYTVDGEKYLVLSDYKTAKRYSSRKRAENAYCSMLGKYSNVRNNFEIVEVDE